MNLRLLPCKKQFKTEVQQSKKILEECTEVLQALADLLMAETYSDRMEARHHMAEEVVDLCTAAITLADHYNLDLRTAETEVIQKNIDRGYYGL